MLLGFGTATNLENRIRGLFSAGEVGVHYDPSDFSTMFQDSAGTTPVTAVTQPVGKILDKSGNGIHATQATSTARPILRQDANGKYYLDFDGVDDFLVTSAIDFSGTDKMSVFVGVHSDTKTASMVIAELSIRSDLNVGSFYILAAYAAADNFLSIQNGTGGFAGYFYDAATAIPKTSVASVIMNLSGATLPDRHTPRINGVVTRDSALGTTGNGGNFGTYPLYIGMRAGSGLPLNGRIYSLIVRGALSDAAQIAAAESYVNSKTGAY